MLPSPHCALLLAFLTILPRLSGAGGFHITLESSNECLDDCGTNPNCRYSDCRVPLGLTVNITCTVVTVEPCDPHTHPLSIHRIDSEGSREITNSNGRDIMPGFVGIQRPADCTLRMSFVATREAEHVVLQCAVHTLDTLEFSVAHVIAVKEPLTDIGYTTTTTYLAPATMTPSPSPTKTPYDSSAITPHTTEPAKPSVTPTTDHDKNESPTPSTQRHSGSQSLSLHRLLLVAVSLVSVLWTVST